MRQDVYERERHLRARYLEMLTETQERMKELNRAGGEWADTVAQVREYERGEQLIGVPSAPEDAIRSAAGSLALHPEWRRRVIEIANQLETWEGWR